MPFFDKLSCLSVTWAPSSVILTLCSTDEGKKVLCVTLCSFSRSSYIVELDINIRNTASRLAHVGRDHALVLTSDGKVYSLLCGKAAGCNTKMSGVSTPVNIVCTQLVAPIVAIDADVTGRVCIADQHHVYFGVWDKQHGRIVTDQWVRVEGVRTVALSYETSSAVYCVARERRVQLIEVDRPPRGLMESVPAAIRDAAEPACAVVATTDGYVYITNDQGGIFCFKPATGALQQVLTSRQEVNALPKDGIGMTAVTTGVANRDTCIGRGGADMVFCELRCPALRHVTSGKAMCKGLGFVANLVDVTGKPHQFVSVETACNMLQSASDYTALLNDFNQTNRGRITGNSAVGSFSDDCRKAVALNLRGYKRLGESMYASRINIAFCSEALVERYFSVLTFHGGDGATRLNQARCGAAFAKSAWYWLKRSPASGNVISKATSIGVMTNRVYQRKTHARPAACNIITFRLTARGSSPRVVKHALIRAAKVLRTRLGTLRQVRVRPATTLWRADGFAVLMSRLKTTSFSLRTNTHEQEADDALDTGEAAGLGDDDSALANADLSDSASATVSQGDDLCVLPPRDDDDPFWICRVVHVGDGVGHTGQQLLVNYYELIDGDAGYYKLDTAAIYTLQCGSIISPCTIETDHDGTYWVDEETRGAMARRVQDIRLREAASRRRERGAAADMASRDAAMRDMEGYSAGTSGTRSRRRGPSRRSRTTTEE